MCNPVTRHGSDANWRNDDFVEDSYTADSRRRVRDRKTAQLCAQAQRTLGDFIQNELLDANLSGLVVAEVRPYPDAGRLLVVLSAPKGCELECAKQTLDDASGKLRWALGRAISRKRVPQLSFAMLPADGERHD
jgi:ribosome-binding factor A